jgi:hypothetical protein
MDFDFGKAVEAYYQRRAAFEENLLSGQNITGIAKAWQLLRATMDDIINAYEHEKVGNEILLKEIAKLRFARGMDAALMSLHQSNFTAAVADYLIHPNPIDIPCTHNNISLTFRLGLTDILLIRSKGRTKIIYLKKKHRAIEGGEEHSVIMVNRNDLDFINLLFLLQRNGNHILRISQSYAVNIFYYERTDKNTFRLLIEPPEGFDKKLMDVKADKYFDAKLYQERLIEIDRLGHHLKDFEVNIAKIEEINRYKKEMGIT